jgi:hypothetical protein
MSEALKPSRGIPPSFGKRAAEYDDGENQLYLMLLSANANALLGEKARHSEHALAKVGRSNDPTRRETELNCGFPETSAIRWKVVSRQAFADGATAHEHETALKRRFHERFQSEGGEFFTGCRDEIAKAFQDFCVEVMPRILGAAARAKGI